MFEERNKKITCIQAAVRRFLAINQFHKLKWQREKAVIKIQACKLTRIYRMYIVACTSWYPFFSAVLCYEIVSLLVLQHSWYRKVK